MRIKKSVIALGLILGSVCQLNATHLLGGEVSWECLNQGSNSGKLIFELVLYRDCQLGSASLGGSYNINNPLYSTYGGPSTINVIRIYQGILGHICYDSSLSIMCGSPRSAIATHAIEENQYRSAPLQVNGIPDSSGSSFWMSTCCRPGSTYHRNINGSGYFMRATMYPYINPTTGTAMSFGSSTTGPTCYDSSPKFAEPPNPFACLKRWEVYKHNTVDSDNDSLVYSWTPPMQTFTNAVTYKTNYSYNSPLPNAAHHASNIPAIMNTTAGTSSFYTHSYTPPGGYHVLGIKSSAYKNGQLTAEVYRDIPLVYLDCDTLPFNPNNPTIEIKKSTDPLYRSSLNDTFILGSTIQLDIRVQDFDSLPTAPISLQSVEVMVEGDAVSTIPNDTTNCLISPCGYLDSNNVAWNGYKFQDTTRAVVRFEWITSCQTLLNNDPNSSNPSIGTFTFQINAFDNSCPFPGDSSLNFSITLIDTNGRAVQVDSLDASVNGAIVSWNRYIGIDFNKYNIYRSYGLTGLWKLVGNVYGQNITNFHDLSSKPDSAMAYYRVNTNNGLGCDSDSLLYRTVKLDLTSTSNFPALSWNTINNTNKTGRNVIYRRDTLGNFERIDSVSLSQTTYVDVNPIYDHFIAYKIESKEYSGFYSISTLDSIKLDKPPVNPGDTTGISINTLSNSFVSHPNPFNNSLNIKTSLTGQITVHVYDIEGKLWVSQLFENSVEINTAHIPMGLYFIKLTDSEGRTHSSKLLKSR